MNIWQSYWKRVRKQKPYAYLSSAGTQSNRTASGDWVLLIFAKWLLWRAPDMTRGCPYLPHRQPNCLFNIFTCFRNDTSLAFIFIVICLIIIIIFKIITMPRHFPSYLRLRSCHVWHGLLIPIPHPLLTPALLLLRFRLFMFN